MIISLILFIVVMGAQVIRSSISRVYSPSIATSSQLMIGSVLTTAFLKEMMARISMSLGVLIDPQLLMTDAWHHLTDAAHLS